MAFDLLFQFTIFGALLAWISRRVGVAAAERRTTTSSQQMSLARHLLRRYCGLVENNKAFQIGVLVALGLFHLVNGIWAVSGLEPDNVRLKQLVPDSPMARAQFKMERYRMAQYVPTTFVVQNCTFLRTPEGRGAFEKLVQSIESLPTAIGRDSTMLWLRDYDAFKRRLKSNLEWILPPAKGERYSNQLDGFLSIPWHRHWRTSVNLDEKG